MKHISLKVPASTANFGPGFDTVGASLSVYLEIEAKTKKQVDILADPVLTISYTEENSENIPTDPEENLILSTMKVALFFWDKLDCIRGLSLEVSCKNNVPLSRGLGSSSTAVVAGVCLANELSDSKLSLEDMAHFCLRYESHPDNIYPCILGGCIVGGYDSINKRVYYNKLKLNQSIKPIFLIPPFELETEKSREAIPEYHELKSIVSNTQRLGLLITSLGQDPLDAEKIGYAMQDSIHQNYREPLIFGFKEMQEEFTYKKHEGVLGVVISGAGSSMMILTIKNTKELSEKANIFYNNLYLEHKKKEMNEKVGSFELAKVFTPEFTETGLIVETVEFDNV